MFSGKKADINDLLSQPLAEAMLPSHPTMSSSSMILGKSIKSKSIFHVPRHLPYVSKKYVTLMLANFLRFGDLYVGKNRGQRKNAYFRYLYVGKKNGDFMAIFRLL